MGVIRGQFLHHIGASLQVGNGKAAVDAGLVGSNHSSARAAGASEIAYLEGGSFYGLMGHAVILPDHQGTQRGVLKGKGLGSPRLDVALLYSGVLDGIALCGFQFLHTVPPVPEIGEGEVTIIIREVDSKVIDLPGEGVIGGVSHTELGALDGIAGHAVQLGDGQPRLRIVLEADGGGLIGYESDELVFLIDEVIIGNALLPNLHHTGGHIFQKDFSFCVCGFRGDGVPIRFLDGKGHASHRFPSNGIGLYNLQVRLGLIDHYQLRVLAGEQFHMVLRTVENIPGGGCYLLNGVNAGGQVVDSDAALGIRHPIQVVTGILHHSNVEGGPGQIFVLKRVVLHNGQRGLGSVGKDEAGILPGLDLHSANAVIDQVSIRGLLFFDGIGPRFQLGQVHLAVLIRSELFGVAASHLGDEISGVGKGLHGLAVHLDEMDAGLHQIEEHKLGGGPLASLQFDLLWRGIHHMGILGVYLFDEVCARFQPGQDDFPGLVRGVCSDERGVPVDLESGIGERLVGLLIELKDAEGGHGLVLYDQPGIVVGGRVIEVDIDAIDLAVQGIALRGLSFLDLKVPTANAVDIGEAVLVGGHGINEGTVFVDLKGSIGQIEMGTGILLADNKSGLPGVLEG